MVPPVRRPPDESLSGRERWGLIVVAMVVLLIGVIATVWAVYQSAADRRAGCVTATMASTTGGVTLHYCGTEAQRWCAAVFSSNDAVALHARDACTAAGYGVKP